MKTRNRLIEFHFGIFLMSTSAVLGRYILASSTIVTLLRCIIGFVALLLILLLFRAQFQFNWKKHGLIMIFSSVFMATHWVTYFYSLDYSNVSIALLTLYTFPAMTAIIEPLVLKKSIPRRDIVLAMVVLLAICIITPPTFSGSKIPLAIALGLVSALCYSIRNIWMAQLSPIYEGSTLMLFQLIIMSFLLSPAFIFIHTDWSTMQWGAILILGIGTTAIAHTLFVRGLSYYSAATASLLACIIPIYAILWGYLILGEIPDLRTIIGGCLILSVVFAKAVEKRT